MTYIYRPRIPPAGLVGVSLSGVSSAGVTCSRHVCPLSDRSTTTSRSRSRIDAQCGTSITIGLQVRRQLSIIDYWSLNGPTQCTLARHVQAKKSTTLNSYDYCIVWETNYTATQKNVVRLIFCNLQKRNLNFDALYPERMRQFPPHLTFNYFTLQFSSNDNNDRISIMPYGRNFKGAGGRSDQCSVKAWLNRKVLSLVR